MAKKKTLIFIKESQKMKKQKNYIQFIALIVSLISLLLSVLSLASFIYLQDLHTKTTVSSSSRDTMLLYRVKCLEGDKEFCEQNKQENHQKK